MAIIAYIVVQAIAYQTPTLTTSTAIKFSPRTALFDFKATCLDPTGCVVIPASVSSSDVKDFDVSRAMVVQYKEVFTVKNTRATSGT